MHACTAVFQALSQQLVLLLSVCAEAAHNSISVGQLDCQLLHQTQAESCYMHHKTPRAPVYKTCHVIQLLLTQVDS